MFAFPKMVSQKQLHASNIYSIMTIIYVPKLQLYYIYRFKII